MLRNGVKSSSLLALPTPSLMAIRRTPYAKPDVTGGTLQRVVDETVASGSKIEYDGYKSYRNLSGVALDAKKYETGDLHWLHKAISNLKAFLLGTYRGRCTQLQSYLGEFCFRFNRRKTGDRIFMRLARAVAASCAQLH